MSTKIMTTETIDELVSPLRTALTRRDLIKKLGIGAGGLAAAAVVGLKPDRTEAAAAAAALYKPRLRILKSGAAAKINTFYTLQLSPTAVSNIRRGQRYGIWFTIYHAEDNKRVHAWASGPLPAQEWFEHGSSQRLKWSYVRKYGTVFYATMTVFKWKNGQRVRVGSTVVTPYYTLGS